MAFVVLLIVSLSTVGRIETSRSYTQRQTALARQQAFYALDLALGQLQDAAGPDRRVTARAEILGAGGGDEPMWTGVWNAPGTAGPIWLVTDDPSDAARPSPLQVGASVQIVGQGSAGPRPQGWVNVPLLSLRTPNNAGVEVETARIAWWTADEGVKASIHGLDTIDRIGLDAATAQRLRQQANAGTAWRDWMADDSPLSMLTEREWLAALSPEQILGWIPEEVIEGAESDLQARFHDLTLNAVGLLTNPLDGGLKLNLSAAGGREVPGSYGDVFGSGQALTVWRDYPEPDASGTVPLRPIDPLTFASVAPGEPYRQIAPILTECALYMSVYHHSSGEPALRYYIDAEFWNPFTMDLELAADSDRRAFTVELRQLPELTVENRETGAVVGPIAVDETRRNDGLAVTASWMEFGEPTGGGSRGDFKLNAGEVYRLEDPDPDAQGRGLVKRTNQALPIRESPRVYLQGFPPSGSSGADFIVSAGSVPGGGQVFRVSDVPYDAFRYAFPGGPVPYVPSGGVVVRDDYIMAFHYRIGSSTSWQTEADWLWAFDFREPSIRYGDNWRDLEGTERPNAEFISIANRNPVLVRNNLNAVRPGNEIHFDAVARESVWEEYGDVRLYDLPVGEPITLADFRILPFKGLPPLSLGSHYAQARELNAAFDRYALFPQVLNPVSGELEPANTRHQLLPISNGAEVPGTDDLAGPEAAQFYGLRGAFNWNSTSVAAWYAQLVQSFEGQQTWRYTDRENREAVASAPAAIFRHTQGAGHRQQPLTDAQLQASGPGSLERRFTSFRQGVRLLERPRVPLEEMDPARDPLFRLANAIVAELRSRGRPYTSLSALLNDGLLQRAIERSEINRGILPHAVGFIRQSDLVGLLSLAPAVRSDTFLIRAMGQVVNPATGELEGEAWIEARVQRTVDFVDRQLRPATRLDSVDRGPAEARRFQIVSFRWLNPADEF
jgi:hypothetical protein